MSLTEVNVDNIPTIAYIYSLRKSRSYDLIRVDA